jgi:hypothetical protein
MIDVSLNSTTVTKPLFDLVFPSLEEVSYCIKRDLVSKKELILFKLILDYNEALFNANIMSVAKAYDVLVPTCLRFYKQLSSQEMKTLLERMQKINTKIIEKQNKPPSDPMGPQRDVL